MAIGEAAEPMVRAAPSTVAVSPHVSAAATRHLCAAAHLRAPMLPAPRGGRLDSATLLGLASEPRQPSVGRRYTREVLDSAEMLAMLPGIDADRVMVHCRAARRQIWIRDVILGLILVASGLALILAVALVAFRYAPKRARRELAPALIALALVCLALGPFGGLTLLAPVVGLAACWLVFVVNSLVARSRIRRLEDPLNDPQSLWDHPMLAWLPRREAPRRHERRMPNTDGSSGWAVPYARSRIVGAGVSYGNRTITVAVDKAATDGPAEHFRAHELLEHIADHARVQGRPHEPTHGIPQLDVSLVLAVPELFWMKSEKRVPSEVIYRYADTPQSGAAKRALVRIQAVTWDGQLVVSLFVSVALEGRYLTVTVLPHVLSPMVGELRICDRLASRHALVHASHATVDAVRELRQLGGRLRKATERAPAEDHSKRPRKEHKRPRLLIPREAYAQIEPENVAQHDDALRIINIVQTRVFDMTEQFLRDHGIDTDEFASQVQIIMQNSVLVHGDVSGTVQNVNGNGAQANNNPGPQKGSKP